MGGRDSPWRLVSQLYYFCEVASKETLSQVRDLHPDTSVSSDFVHG